jgi:PHD/YefM family antitoxin component YafN of YafNO toxin-antitoxin module
MHTIALKKFLKNPGAFITAVDIEPVLLVQEEAENLMLIREADWRTLQETIYLLNSPVNAERLKSSVTEVLNNTALDTAE